MPMEFLNVNGYFIGKLKCIKKSIFSVGIFWSRVGRENAKYMDSGKSLNVVEILKVINVNNIYADYHYLVLNKIYVHRHIKVSNYIYRQLTSLIKRQYNNIDRELYVQT